jgi:tetratricopeptide (TPR) repeat protein
MITSIRVSLSLAKNMNDLKNCYFYINFKFIVMKSSSVIKIVISLVVLLVVAGLIYYFFFNPSAKYDKLITHADEKFKVNMLDDAKGLYTKALEIKQDEVYPRRQIRVIDSISRQIELQIRYDEKIQKADQLFAEEKYPDASQYYFEAANLLPDADYPLTQIKKIQKVLNDPLYAETEKAPKAGKRIAEPARTKTGGTAGNLAGGKNYHLVVGVFSNHQKALELNRKLIDEGRDSRIIPRPGNREAVTFGSYKDFNTAASFLEFVKSDINKNAWVLHHQPE